MKLKKIINLIILFFFIYKGNILHSESASVQSDRDYKLTLNIIREMDIIVANFGDEKTNKNFNYSELKAIFKQAAERHYAQEFLKPVYYTESEDTKIDQSFQSSLDLFQKLKIELIKTLDVLSKEYIKRTRSILDSTSRETNDVIVKYSKKSSLARYFYMPINPLYEPKPYTTSEFHFFYKRTTLETYLKNGYKTLQDGINIFKNGDFLYINSKKTKTPREYNYLLTSYLNIIKYCRLAKQYGIEIHKKLKENQLPLIQQKYDISYKKIQNFQIFDDRIPESYKIDAIDNKKMSFKIEKERLARWSKIIRLNPDKLK